MFERQALETITREQRLGADTTDSIPRARYIVTGSVSHLGSNDKNVGALLGAVASIATFRHGFGVLNRNYRDTAIREATERAATAIAEAVIALRATLQP